MTVENNNACIIPEKFRNSKREELSYFMAR
jgi:hypothetical protein